MSHVWQVSLGEVFLEFQCVRRHKFNKEWLSQLLTCPERTLEREREHLRMVQVGGVHCI